LRRIFNSPLYVGCLDGGRGYNKLGTERPGNARFWIPLIGLHTGASPGEIRQLDVTDIRKANGIPSMVISVASREGSSDKRLKTGASDRVVPLHKRLLDYGLLSFAEGKRREGAIKLFDDIEVGEKGSRSVAFSKWFTQFLRNCGASRERTSFHSFRHNFHDELRAACIEHDIATLLGGWTAGAISRAVSENYGSGYRVETLRDAISKLDFADIDLRHLTLHAR
jgi:integrase